MWGKRDFRKGKGAFFVSTSRTSKTLRPGLCGKGMGGFVGGSNFKPQWGQKFTCQKKRKKKKRIS